MQGGHGPTEGNGGPGARDAGMNLASWTCRVPPPARGPCASTPGAPTLAPKQVLGALLTLSQVSSREKVSFVSWKDGKRREENRAERRYLLTRHFDGWLRALEAWHAPRVNDILVLHLPELITNPGQTCEIIHLIRQLLMLFSSKNSHFRALTLSRANPRDPGHSDAHKPMAILRGDPVFPQRSGHPSH